MTTKERVDDYVESWERRVVANAPSNETADDVLKLMRGERYVIYPAAEAGGLTLRRAVPR